MKLLVFHILILSLLSCGTEEPVAEKKIILNIDTSSSNSIQPEEEVKSRYHYDQDWELFKSAVLTKDIKGMAAFASSDEIDSECLLQVLSDSEILKKLNSTTYKDLAIETKGEFTYLVFSMETLYDDEEGNKYESGVYLYFTQGESNLLLDYYLKKKKKNPFLN